MAYTFGPAARQVFGSQVFGSHVFGPQRLSAWQSFSAGRDSNEQVIIDGTCSSACTLVLGLVPTRRICVTRNAVFGFHAAWRPGFLGLPVINGPATRTLWSLYPMPIRQWIARNGGLTDKMLYLSGSDLFALYRECE